MVPISQFPALCSVYYFIQVISEDMNKFSILKNEYNQFCSVVRFVLYIYHDLPNIFLHESWNRGLFSAYTWSSFYHRRKNITRKYILLSFEYIHKSISLIWEEILIGFFFSTIIWSSIKEILLFLMNREAQHGPLHLNGCKSGLLLRYLWSCTRLLWIKSSQNLNVRVHWIGK